MEEKRLLRYGRDIAEAIAEGMRQEMERRLAALEIKLRERGIESGSIVVRSASDMVVNGQLTAKVSDESSVLGVMHFMQNNFRFVAAAWGAVGFSFPEVERDLQGSFDMVSLVTGDVVAEARGDNTAHFIFTSYQMDQSGQRRLWNGAEEMLKRIYEREKETHRKPADVLIRLHWNPYQDENSLPYRPDHRPLHYKKREK
jgi:hypothetical protein